MVNLVETMIERSQRDFRDIVWPAIRDRLGGGIYEPVEGSREALARRLDMLAGFDGMQYLRNGVRGIASRVQYTRTAFRTFTIRYRIRSGARTEFAKRLDAIRRAELGYLCPGVTVQAYVYSDRLRYAAICHSRDLYPAVEDWLRGGETSKAWTRENGSDGTIFAVVSVDALRAAGIRVEAVYG